MFQTFDLDQYRDLFRDEQSFRKVADALRSSCQEGFRPIIVEKRVIGSTMSSTYTKKMLAARLVQRAIQQPDLLDDLAKRLDSEEVVE